MNNFIRIYLLLPLIAILLGAAIYLCLVAGIYKLLTKSRYIEEIIWKYYVSKNIVKLEDDRSIKLQLIVNQLSNKIDLITIKNKQINAFAAPSGKIIITSGLLDNIKDEKALIFVIAHEIAHIKRKDYLYEFSRYVVLKLYKNLWLSEMVPEILQLIDNRKIREAEFAADKYAAKILMQKYGNLNGAKQLIDYLALIQNSSQTALQERLINLGLQK